MRCVHAAGGDDDGEARRDERQGCACGTSERGQHSWDWQGPGAGTSGSGHALARTLPRMTVPALSPDGSGRSVCSGGRRHSSGHTRRTPATTSSTPMPPPTTDATGPKSAAVAPLSKAPNSFEKPTNTDLMAETRPRSSSGVISCSSVSRMTTLIESNTPVAKRQASDSKKSRDRPEADGGHAVAGHGGEQHPAGMPPRRQPRLDERHQHRADRRRGAQPAEPLRPDLQDVLGEDRQQRRRPAEQHREEVEGDRRQVDAAAAHEAEAGEHAAPAGLARRGEHRHFGQPQQLRHEEQLAEPGHHQRRRGRRR